jgi:hypothetical protein
VKIVGHTRSGNGKKTFGEVILKRRNARMGNALLLEDFSKGRKAAKN